jgi:hypothetical protein
MAATRSDEPRCAMQRLEEIWDNLDYAAQCRIGPFCVDDLAMTVFHGGHSRLVDEDAPTIRELLPKDFIAAYSRQFGYPGTPR